MILMLYMTIYWFGEMQVASRMVSAFSRWKRYDEDRQKLAKVINLSFFHICSHFLLLLNCRRWVSALLKKSGVFQAQLERIMSSNGLSENVYEIASKSLAA